MSIANPRSIIFKIMATVVTLLFLLMVFTLPVSAKAGGYRVSPVPAKVGKIKEFTVPTRK